MTPTRFVVLTPAIKAPELDDSLLLPVAQLIPVIESRVARQRRSRRRGGPRSGCRSVMCSSHRRVGPAVDDSAGPVARPAVAALAGRRGGR